MSGFVSYPLSSVRSDADTVSRRSTCAMRMGIDAPSTWTSHGFGNGVRQEGKTGLRVLEQAAWFKVEFKSHYIYT